MASPKSWGLYYKRAVPSPIASHALYSGNLSLLLGVKSECLSTASSVLGLLLHLRSHLHQWCLLTSHSAKPPCSPWPLHAFTTSIIWETLRCCPSSAASNRFSLCPLRITASGCRPWGDTSLRFGLMMSLSSSAQLTPGPAKQHQHQFEFCAYGLLLATANSSAPVLTGPWLSSQLHKQDLRHLYHSQHFYLPSSYEQPIELWALNRVSAPKSKCHRHPPQNTRSGLS